MKHRTIKVALINNMNNNFFAFSRYLRDLGIDAHVFVNPDAPPHFNPQYDTFEDVSKLPWLHTFPYGDSNKDWLIAKTDTIRKILQGFDIIISCGLSSAYIERAGLTSDIIFPYGSDLYDLPFRTPKFVFGLDFPRSLLHTWQAYYQKKAYTNARCISIEASSVYYKAPLQKLTTSWINTTIPMLYNLEKSEDKVLDEYIPNHSLNQLEHSDFVVFNHSRHLWSTNIHNLDDFDKYLGMKRNDKVIRAFAEFLKTTRMKTPLLVLFEYGHDVNDSKKLVHQLNIDEHVLWLPKSPRKVILLLLKKYATFGTGQFRERISAGFGGVSYEILASGVPLLTKLADTEFFNASPAINVLTEEEILNVFKDYEKNPEKYRKIGQRSQRWFTENLGLGKAKKYATLIEQLAVNSTLSHNDAAVKKIFEQ